MSAKQSLDYSNWVRQEVANLPSPNRGKTLKPRSKKPGSIWKRVLSKRLDKGTRHACRMFAERLEGCDAKDRVVTRLNTKVASKRSRLGWTSLYFIGEVRIQYQEKRKAV